MKRKLLLTLLLTMGYWSHVFAQTAILSGRITDASTKESLAGAAIAVQGTSRGTATNLEGDYLLRLSPGTYTLQVKYVGYQDTTLQVTMEEGKGKVLNIKLSGSAVELSGVVINGNLQGQAQALNQQKTADNIKNIVAADQIGRFPDPNAAEALQRIPGVNIERDQGEGRYVLIRGLSPKFTNISVNGEQIPSPEAGVRFVALDAIPADQLASMEVTKALTPDMDGDAVGGNVNLITRTAQSSRPKISASLAGGYNNLMNKPNLQGSLQYEQRLGKKEKLGILLNSSYYHNDLGSDNWEREPFDNELELRDYELTRTRHGLSSTINYNFNAKHEIYFRALYSRFTDREWRRRYVFKPEDEEIERLTKDRFEAQAITSINFGGRHSLSRLNVDYEVQYSYGEQDTPYDNEGSFIAGIPGTLNFSNPNWPKIQAEGYLDNTQYEFDAFEYGRTRANDQNITAKINLGLPYTIGRSEGLLKFGGKVRLKEKSYSITQNGFEARGEVPTLDYFEGGLLDKHFLDDRYTIARNLEMGKLIKYFNENITDFELEIEDKAIDEALESYTAEENVYSGYLMARQQISKLMLLGGVRYEKTNVKYTSSDVIIAANGDLEEIRPVSGESDYDFLLPQLHVKYAFSPYTNIRAATTYSYARPNFDEIVPAQEANLEDEEATVGNTALQPVSAFNLDLMGEHYFGNIGIVSGGFFYKKLKDFIYPRVLFNSQYPLTGTPVATGITVTQAQNGEDANLLGFELAVQRNLDFLPGFLSGFSVYANYTYTDSKAKIQNRSEDNVAFETITLPGQASNVGNFSLSYDSKKFSGRIAVNFNGEYMSEVGGTAAEDLYIANRSQVDLSGSYTITGNIRFFAEFLNITNQPFEAYMGSKDIKVQREFYSWWSRAGVKFDF